MAIKICSLYFRNAKRNCKKLVSIPRDLKLKFMLSRVEIKITTGKLAEKYFPSFLLVMFKNLSNFRRFLQ